jgi:hypothetical protein
MKVWRETHPARFEYLKNETIQLHDHKRTLPLVGDPGEEEGNAYIKLTLEKKVSFGYW